MRAILGLAASTVFSLTWSQGALGVTLGQVDDFEGGTLQGWSEGPASPTPPVLVTGGGPGGASDPYLENVSSGQDGAGGKWVIMNSAQWTGDYPAANVNAIRIWFRNSGGTPLTMRLAFEGAATHYGSQGFALPADGQWYEAHFFLDEVVLIGGIATPLETLSSVNAMRILAATNPSWVGDQVATMVGIDGITAVHSEVSVALETWGSLKTRYAGSARPVP